LQSKVTTRLPASFLHLHPDVTVFCDRAAASTL
jgi:6-phosphogluconolactonase/glucosamine-6-phosphate isomerase/deaminase